MEANVFLSILKRKKQTIVVIVIFCFLIAGFLTIIQPFMYQSESKVLVYQDNTDPYAMSKSGQYLSSLLTNIITTSSFYEAVASAGYNIDVLYFSSNEADRLAIWRNTVKPSVVDDSGVFKVDVFHVDPYQAEQISQAINYVLKTKHNTYHGAGDKVTIKILDSPMISSYPVRPRFILNFFAGIVCGMILSFLYIYLFPEDKFNIKIFPKTKEKKQTVNFSKVEIKNEKEEEEKRNIENTRQIKLNLERALKAQLAMSVKKNKTKSVVEPISRVEIINEKVVDIEDIEREGSISNIIGFSNLGY